MNKTKINRKRKRAFNTNMIKAALLNAISSSTDNFVVGFGIGIRGISLGFHFNIIISFANALGAFCSTFFGATLLDYTRYKDGTSSINLPSFLSSAIFLLLAIMEFQAYWMQRQNRGEPKASSCSDSNFQMAPNVPDKSQSIKSAMKLAFPMTLNNLASGVAGGIGGYSAIAMFGYAFFASFFLMIVGSFVGYVLYQNNMKLMSNASNTINGEQDFALVSCALFLVLAWMQVYDIFDDEWNEL